MYKDFRVLTPSELIEHYELAVPNRPPDHSVLLCSLNFPDWSESAICEDDSTTRVYGSTTRFNVRSVPTNFLNDTEILRKVDETIHKLEEHLNASRDIDSA